MPTTVIVPFPPSAPVTPAGSDFELEINRRNTTAYIASDPTDIRFRSRARVSDGEGGTVWDDGDLLPAQRVRIVTPRSSSTGDRERRNVDGEAETPEIMLVMEWDAAVESGWTYTHDDKQWEVIFINDDFSGKYQKHAEVISR